MPSSFTKNYQLSQWERSDKVQMEDFNADNAKIDTALKAQADTIAAETKARETALSAETAARTSALSALETRSTTQTIKSVTVSAATTSYTLSLSGITWSQWREVMVVAQIYPIGGTIPLFQVYPEGSSSSSPIGSGKFPIVLLLFPAYSSSYSFAGISFGTNPQPFNHEVSFSSITGLRFAATSGTTIPANSRITLYGVK